MSLPIPLYGLVTFTEKRKAKNDRLFWQVELRTQIGAVKSFIWGVSADVATNPKYPHVSDLIQITDFEDQMASHGSVVINGFSRITKADLPPEAQFICEVPKASDEDYSWAKLLIYDNSFWESESNHAFTMECLSSLGLDLFSQCPAAMSVHHTYEGGLLVHTAEVLDLCRLIAEHTHGRKYNFIDRDVLYCSAILHDAGKAKTYSFNSLGMPMKLPTEKTISHIFYSMNLVQSNADRLPGSVSAEFINEVLHSIAAHHGTLEWGSLRIIQSLEAGILSRADYISSRNGIIDSLLKDIAKTGASLQDEFKIYSDPYFATIGMKKYLSQN